MNEPRRKRRGIVRSHKVLQVSLIPFMRRKRRGIKPSARIKLKDIKKEAVSSLFLTPAENYQLSAISSSSWFS